LPYASESHFPWLNVIQYPFLTREFDAGDGWMSYADHGHGRPIVFLHGNPTWSYLFRHLIKEFGRNHRCIAPDMLGYGLSDKPRKADYRPETQAARFASLMDYLNLEDVTLVVHCIGGPVGLSWALDHPERVRNLVVFNSWMWGLEDNMPAFRLSRLVGNPFNRIYYRFLPASPTFILPALFADRHNLPRPTKVQYLEPFRIYRDRMALYAAIEGLSKSRQWFNDLWSRRAILEEKRALLLWGMKDPIFGSNSLERFEEMLPYHETHPVRSCGRFVPEEAPKEATDVMRWFLLNHSAVTVR
jgi:haloalkane dehalogenase